MIPESSSDPVKDPAVGFFNRELSWLAFARRVLAQVESSEVPLLERVKFAGIMGMLHDEFFMKRMSGLKRQIRRTSAHLSHDGRTPQEEFLACREEILQQVEILSRVMDQELRPALQREGLPIFDYDQISREQQLELREYFRRAVQPILTPLAVDKEHPFPFISNGTLNLSVLLLADKSGQERFVRIKVPSNRPRWVPVEGSRGVVPLEQVIASNLDLMFPSTPPQRVYLFRVTRGADGDALRGEALNDDEDDPAEPGSLVRQVSSELKARRFAGVVRLQVDREMPKGRVRWLARQLQIGGEDVYPVDAILGLRDLRAFHGTGREDLRFPRHEPVTHPRLRGLSRAESHAVFEEIRRGDILLHHPYHAFDDSVLRFLQSAAEDPAVLAIKLTIYRTSGDSPIVQALAEALRRGKQVAVVVEITARFDEAPNIAWGKYLEEEGAHVTYGVERLKTHVKLSLVVREEKGLLHRYAHVGTGNYHTGTARVYEDLGVLTADPGICADVAAVFNELTGALPYTRYEKMLIAPGTMRKRFTELIRREVAHARAGRPAGIYAKMNQLQDDSLIRELYRASGAGVPVTLNVRGVCCLRPGVPGMSENIRVYSLVGRFLEHSRVYRFLNGGDPEYYLGSADWMRRNLDRRVETIMPVLSPPLKVELERLIRTYDEDNCSVWDCGPEGVYARRVPAAGEPRRCAQEVFILLAGEMSAGGEGRGGTAEASPGEGNVRPPAVLSIPGVARKGAAAAHPRPSPASRSQAEPGGTLRRWSATGPAAGRLTSS